MTSDAALSKMLFGAREELEMFADIVEREWDKPAESTRRLIAEIDAFREWAGWSPHGFGGEAASSVTHGAMPAPRGSVDPNPRGRDR